MDTIDSIFEKIPQKLKKTAQIPKNLSQILSEKQNNTISHESLYKNLFPEYQGPPGSQILKEISTKPEIFSKKLEEGTFLLEKFVKKREEKPNSLRSSRFFAKKLEKQLKFFKIPASYSKFSAYEPMNRLWKQYISQETGVLTKKTQENEAQILQKILKADLHGAIISVVSAKCENYEGISGIILRETKNCLRLVTKNDRILTIPKENCVFLLDFPEKPVKIFGKALCCRPADRVKKLLKMKKFDEFLLKSVEI